MEHMVQKCRRFRVERVFLSVLYTQKGLLAKFLMMYVID